MSFFAPYPSSAKEGRQRIRTVADDLGILAQGAKLLTISLKHIYTLFLFTKSDIKATLVPISIAGALVAPVHSTGHLIEEVGWIWLHLLQFNTSNQSCSATALTEDADNKPDRPIPSGRMTLSQTRLLRWLLVPVCCWMSSFFGKGVVVASVAIMILTIWYNELNGGGRHWFIRNTINGLGFCSFETGAILMASESRIGLDTTAIRAILLSTWIFFTTAHAQDFKDVIGDKKIARSTVALDLPRIARPSILVGLVVWSWLLGQIWLLSDAGSLGMVAFGAYVGGRYCLVKGKGHDQISFYWYNAWLSLAYALPGLKRHWLL